MNITYLKVMGRPSCGLEIIAITQRHHLWHVQCKVVNLWIVMQQQIIYDCGWHFSNVL